jgi:hypothetical protein
MPLETQISQLGSGRLTAISRAMRRPFSDSGLSVLPP